MKKMGTKVKDYYDVNYGYFLSEKISNVYENFDEEHFISLLKPELETLSFNNRQILLAESLKSTIQLNYDDTIYIFTKILGDEIEGSLGMFTQGWWLWPLSKYVELYGYNNFEVSTTFSKELTKRFTGEYCMRPLIESFPQRSMDLLLEWSLDDNKRIRRCASECLRIRLPWAKKMYIALEWFDTYKQILTNLKDDTDKTIQKSVANNLNDLYKESPELFEEIIDSWKDENVTKACTWIINHGSRTKRKVNLLS